MFPLFSARELKYGIPVTDENGNRLGESANAAQQAIVQVVVSRIGMAVPAMGNFKVFKVTVVVIAGNKLRTCLVVVCSSVLFRNDGINWFKVT